MAIHDPIADMITVVRNGVRSNKSFVNVKKSSVTLAILKSLKKNNYIYDFKELDVEGQGLVRVYLEIPIKLQKEKTIRKIKQISRVSRPGLRIYSTAKDMPKILNGIGHCVVSTSKGVMTGYEAKARKIGGEIMLKVW